MFTLVLLTAASTEAVVEAVEGAGEVIWQRPPGQLRGLALGIHGCRGTARNHFLPSASCTSCYFMPVENRLREMCLARGLMFVALSSTDRTLSCWTKGKNVLPGEMDRLRAALAHVRAQLADDLPWYVIGTSSGGIVALQMPRYGLYPDGIISVVMGVPSSMLAAADGRPFPRTAFVHMTRDRGTVREVRSNVAHLRGVGAAVLELPLQPSAITPDFFERRDPNFSAERSAAVAASLQAGGFLNAQLQVLARALAAPPSLLCLRMQRLQRWHDTTPAPVTDSLYLRPWPYAPSSLPPPRRARAGAR
jgi:hypothetical protein